MNLYCRLLFALIQGRWRKRLTPFETAETAFRVLPQDIDVFGHMNNGRYLQIMDIARAQWMQRTGVLPAMRSAGWGAVLGGNLVRYRHALKLFQRYVVQTHLIYWNDRWFFFEHAFLDGSGRSIAVGFSRAALRHRQGWVGTDVVVDAVAPGTSAPPMPGPVEQWLIADRAAELYRSSPDTICNSDRLEQVA